MKNKGLSILIPIYNFSVVELVNNLVNQASLLDVPFEIRCYDDFSSDYTKENSSIESFTNVVYKKLPANQGRSKIRNLLAFEAEYSTLLFLDCDSKINNSNYLQQYLNYIDKDYVVYGGRSYQSSPPNNPDKLLHWKYGNTRETGKAEKRSKCPYYSFMSNNFIISRKHFLLVKMDETLKGYGYEDTLFGISLKTHDIKIVHIDNPLCHIGLEDNYIFLKKTHESIKNLVTLTSNNIKFNTKLYRYYKFISKTRLTFIFEFIYSIFKTGIEKNLKSLSPSLIFFDIYKLNLISKEHRSL